MTLKENHTIEYDLILHLAHIYLLLIEQLLILLPIDVLIHTIILYINHEHGMTNVNRKKYHIILPTLPKIN